MIQSYPCAFVALICAFMAMVPMAWRFYRKNKWRVPLSHYFVLTLFIAILLVSVLHYGKTVHRLEEVAFEWSSLWWSASDANLMSDHASNASVPYTPMLKIIVAALRSVAIPATCTLCISVLWNVFFASYVRDRLQKRIGYQGFGASSRSCNESTNHAMD